MHPEYCGHLLFDAFCSVFLVWKDSADWYKSAFIPILNHGFAIISLLQRRLRQTLQGIPSSIMGGTLFSWYDNVSGEYAFFLKFLELIKVLVRNWFCALYLDCNFIPDYEVNFLLPVTGTIVSEFCIVYSWLVHIGNDFHHYICFKECAVFGHCLCEVIHSGNTSGYTDIEEVETREWSFFSFSFQVLQVVWIRFPINFTSGACKSILYAV